MKTVTVKPSELSGKILVPPSKSMAHRSIICAFLSEGTSSIDNIELSDDIIATCGAVEALGAEIDIVEGSVRGRKKLIIHGTGSVNVKKERIDCGESGSTARFIIPISRLSGEKTVIDGRGKLVERPFDVFFPIFDAQNIGYRTDHGKLPLVLEGSLKPGEFRVRGDVSSQFISGLLFALPLLPGNSTIIPTTRLESAGYIDMTIEMQKRFGILIHFDRERNIIEIPGWQRYIPQNYIVEGDWSQAAFWLVAGALTGPVSVEGLNIDSTQGDKVIETVLKDMGADISWDDGVLMARGSALNGISVDVSQFPDLLPVLAVAGAYAEGKTVLYNAARLRIKESDRLRAIATELKAVGADVTELEESLEITGKQSLAGGRVYGWNDHRIVMSAAVMASKCRKNVTIEGSEAVNKSYPAFWEHYAGLGGRII
ncbi:MAG: 3-phosphoshikimate 1-carboxyvinyltransferase [Clostridiaceae bacterium]|nr:3-phosphoshikimate 1-carboxyvinyltransferase [Clostridiaceae bacterium]